jgi:putative membrane-bound dehydrogenase-like protein
MPDQVACRRYIRLPHKIDTDPFGDKTVRANMHPGHQNPDTTGPSGPEDPEISLFGLRRPDGSPIALWASFGMHYFSDAPVSADYFGVVAEKCAAKLKTKHPQSKVVAMLANGTSGDMWLAAYDQPAPNPKPDIHQYAEAFTAKTMTAWEALTWHSQVPLGMEEAIVPLRYRVPDEQRLAWAREQIKELGDKLPVTKQQIYAWEAMHLHEKQQTELKVQAIRLGDLAITALPNEVYALTGLKFKAMSPLPMTMNISLANGAEGYIPPPEQHRLGGYNTWPARSAGLEVQAEPILVDTVLTLLEKMTATPRRKPMETTGAYPEAIQKLEPFFHWRLDEMVEPRFHDLKHPDRSATLHGNAALFLEGPGGPAFSGDTVNRCLHLAGGNLRGPDKPSGDNYSVSFWFWNAMPANARPISGYLFSAGTPGDKEAAGDHLGVGGTLPDGAANRLFFFNGNQSGLTAIGKNEIKQKAWHHVVLVREGQQVRAYLDGRKEPEFNAEIPSTVPSPVSLIAGGRCDDFANWEGKLDEAAYFTKALTSEEAASLYQTSGFPVAVHQAAPEPSTMQPDYPALSPQDSLKTISVPEGFAVDLVASEPNIMDPVAFDWDANGNLWIAEMADYPEGNGASGGRIRVLLDEDGDGRYETSRLFAEGLSFPNGILTWRDGIIVTVAPEVLFLRDTNGDGKADHREVLLSGFGTGNQQLRVNGLRWGLDNRVYLAAGGHTRDFQRDTLIKSHRDNKEIAIGSRDASFNPDTGDLRPESGPSQFGRVRDDWGRWFGVQNSHPLWHYVIPDHMIARNPAYSVNEVKNILIPPNPTVYATSPSTRLYHGAMQAGQITSACGQEIYRDTLLFPANEITHSFTCEPSYNLLFHLELKEDGSTFAATRPAEVTKKEILASTDTWFRPVMARTGPDGALWMADMYRAMIEHPAWLPAAAKPVMAPLYRAGDDKGRLYRIHRTGQTAQHFPALAKASSAELVGFLDNTNGWIRDKAHMMIWWNDSDFPEQALRQLVTDAKQPVARVHALSLLSGKGRLQPQDFHTAIQDPHPGVRENAVRLSPSLPLNEIASALKLASGDSSSKVKLALALALGEWNEPAAGNLLAKMLLDNKNDPWITAAIMTSATHHLSILIHQTAAAPESAASLTGALCQMALHTKQPDLLSPYFVTAFPPGNQTVSLPQLNLARQLLEAIPANEITTDSTPLGQKFSGIISHYLTRCETLFATEKAATEVKLAAALVLASHPATMEKGISHVASFLSPIHEPGIQHQALEALGKQVSPKIPALVIEAWNQLAPDSKSRALDTLLSREPWTIALLEAITQGTFPMADLDAARRVRLEGSRSPKIKELVAKVLKPQGKGTRAEVVEKFRPALALKGNAENGKMVFAQLCLACHKTNNQGGEVGPDLRSVAGHPPEKLLASILDPSADIQPGFAAYECVLTSGEQLQGFIASETATSLNFRLVSGINRVISRQDIHELRSLVKSLMPEGLEAGLTHQRCADLIAYLQNQSPPIPNEKPKP